MRKRLWVTLPAIAVCWVLAFAYPLFIGWKLGHPVAYFFATGLGPLAGIVTEIGFDPVGLFFAVLLGAGIVSHPIQPKLWTAILSVACTVAWFFISTVVLLLDGS